MSYPGVPAHIPRSAALVAISVVEVFLAVVEVAIFAYLEVIYNEYYAGPANIISFTPNFGLFTAVYTILFVIYFLITTRAAYRGYHPTAATVLEVAGIIFWIVTCALSAKVLAVALTPVTFSYDVSSNGSTSTLSGSFSGSLSSRAATGWSTGSVSSQGGTVSSSGTITSPAATIAGKAIFGVLLGVAALEFILFVTALAMRQISTRRSKATAAVKPSYDAERTSEMSYQAGPTASTYASRPVQYRQV